MQIRENLNTSELTKSPYSLQTEFSRCTKIYQSQYFLLDLLDIWWRSFAWTQASKVLIRSLWVTMAIDLNLLWKSKAGRGKSKTGRRNLLLLQSLQATIPHLRQWCRLDRVSRGESREQRGVYLLTRVNWTFLQCMQVFASLSGTHTAAWLSAGFFPDFRMSSSIHCEDLKMKETVYWTEEMSTLLMWAIHSCFSVAVAAYTANDFPRVQISQPFLNGPSSSRDCSFTSWRGQTW